MRIERVTEEDADRLLEIYGPYVKETAISFEYEVPSQEEFRDRIRSISSQYPYIKAVDEESAILGYAYAAAFKSRAAYDWGWRLPSMSGGSAGAEAWAGFCMRPWSSP